MSKGKEEDFSRAQIDDSVNMSQGGWKRASSGDFARGVRESIQKKLNASPLITSLLSINTSSAKPN